MSGNIIGGFFTEVEADLIEKNDDHIHSGPVCFPTQASPVPVAATASIWGNFTNIVEIMSSGDAPSDLFDIHWVVISAISANGDYELRLFSGAAGFEVFIACVPFSRSATFSQEGSTRTQTALVLKETRISAALSSSNAMANTADIKIVYHEY